MKIVKYVALTLLSFGTIIASASAHAINRLEIEYYGNLQDSTWGVTNSYVFTDATGSFWAYTPYSGNPNYEQSVSFIYESNVRFERWITLAFSPDTLGLNRLIPGIYENAVGFPMNTYGPGLDFSNTGQGFNTLEGRFQIFEIERDSTGRYASLAASFEITGNNGTSKYITGKLWYNTDVFVGQVGTVSTVPEPESIAMLFAGLGLLGVVVRRKQA
ncbi:PEP-CTERM sorting domain-containing protein [Methylophilus flavus]|uniref:PEP-CTERM sorting domain-containing protein n=1 Tax=Methylophilus flavus TaxID=640084 RepID=A0ABW3PIF0_9PROT